jgi:hypothetical protein
VSFLFPLSDYRAAKSTISLAAYFTTNALSFHKKDQPKLVLIETINTCGYFIAGKPPI